MLNLFSVLAQSVPDWFQRASQIGSSGERNVAAGFTLKSAAILSLLAVNALVPEHSFGASVPPFKIVNFGVQGGALSLSINSATGCVYALQTADTIQGYWVDLTNQAGTGNTMSFPNQPSSAGAFYRVAGARVEQLAIYPASPTLAGGAVSLADAVVGTPFSFDISPAPTGLGPYNVTISNSPPAGITISVIGNNTSAAKVRLGSPGTNLVAGERGQFRVTASDSLGTNLSRLYDLRVSAAPPSIPSLQVEWKSGESNQSVLVIDGGTSPLAWTLSSGSPPPGTAWLGNAIFGGTPTASASELNENGLYTNSIRVTDSFTDRVTGQPKPRVAAGPISHHVRYSYRLNIHADDRPNGPGLGGVCVNCHGPGFFPDFVSESALAIINVSAGSGGECSPFYNYVIPGDAGDSLIIQKLAGPPCGARMPYGGPYLNNTQILRFARWISELTDSDDD